jgi:hypothetical protein
MEELMLMMQGIIGILSAFALLIMILAIFLIIKCKIFQLQLNQLQETQHSRVRTADGHSEKGTDSECPEDEDAYDLYNSENIYENDTDFF